MLLALAALQEQPGLEQGRAGQLQPHVSAAPTRKGTALTHRGLASLQQQPWQQIRSGVACKETVGLGLLSTCGSAQSPALMITHAQT